MNGVGRPAGLRDRMGPVQSSDSRFFPEMTAGPADTTKTIRALSALLDLTRAMSSAVELDTLLDVIVQNASPVVEADRTTIFVYDAKSGRLWSRAAPGSGTSTIEVPFESGLVGHVARTLEVINIADAYADQRFNPGFDRSIGYRTRSVLCAPILSGDGRLLGVIQSTNKTTAVAFEPHDESLILELASHVAVAIERAQLTKIHFENEQIEEALNIASDIQLRMLAPAVRPATPGDPFDLVAHIRPAKQVGGDFYDYFAIDESRLCICIGDVSGKGIGAALLMAVTKTLFRANAVVHRDPASLMTSVNTRLYAESGPSMFVTAFCAIVDARSGEIQHCNAGHNAPFIFPRGGPAVTLESSPGIPLGVLPRYAYKAQSEIIKPGSGVYLYTDGVSEASNDADELFTVDRLAEVLNRFSNAPVAGIVAQTLQAVDSFAGPAPQADDITMMCLRYEPA